MTDGLAASVQARLLNRAKARGEDFSLVLSRYAVERFLYRLSVSPDRDRYWLKGALLFDLWFDVHALAREGLWMLSRWQMRLRRRLRAVVQRCLRV